jgi:hypothetical protein
MDATWINSALDGLMSGDAGGNVLSSEAVLLALLVSFCIGHVVAWVYVWTHEGLSYSRMFAGSLLAMPVIVALVMLLMAGNLIIAFGLLAVFTVVRFRNVLKDTRDTTFVLWTIIEGMAAGTMKYGLAVLGCAVVAAVFLYLKLTAFGGRHRYDAILNVQFVTANGAAAVRTDADDDDDDDEPDNERPHDNREDSRFRPVLRRHALRAQLTNRRELDESRRDQTYQLVLRDPSRSRELLKELEATEGVVHVALYRREEESET